MLAGCDDGSFVGFDADLATPLDHVAMFRDVFIDRPEVDMVFGARRTPRSTHDDPCDGTRVASSPPPSTAPHGVYDTQCGAKLFRVDRHGELRGARRAVRDEVVFDCEMIGRWPRCGVGTRRTRGRRAAPKLDPGSSGDASAAWRRACTVPAAQVGGRRGMVKMSDVVKMAWGLVMIRRRYFGSTPSPFEGHPRFAPPSRELVSS